jgi:uncharacterized protein (DUF433 family)
MQNKGLQLILCINKDTLDELLQMYLMGASILEISDYFNLTFENVNEIIDRYSPYL